MQQIPTAKYKSPLAIVYFLPVNYIQNDVNSKLALYQ